MIEDTCQAVSCSGIGSEEEAAAGTEAEGQEIGRLFERQKIMRGAPIKRHCVKKKIFTISFLTRFFSYTANAGCRTTTLADVFNHCEGVRLGIVEFG